MFLNFKSSLVKYMMWTVGDISTEMSSTSRVLSERWDLFWQSYFLFCHNESVQMKMSDSE